MVAAACAATLSCDNGPTTPNVPGIPPGTNTNGSIGGRLTSYGGGALPGATVVFAGASSTTDGTGNFQLNNVPSSGTGVLTVNANGHVFRGVAVALAASRTGIAIDAIRDELPFSLLFYRAFVRNSLESQTLAPIARWTVNPSFYLKTTVENSSSVVPENVILRMRDVIIGSVSELSGGRFEMAAFEWGPDAREAADGWVRITFHNELGAVFGRSTVGGNTGAIDLRYGLVSTQTTNPLNCMTPEVGLLDHEITHTMGFWHTPDVFVDSFSGQGCPGRGRPAHVQYHAGLAYSRPVGNRDPDVDPVESAQTASRGPRPIVECTWR